MIGGGVRESNGEREGVWERAWKCDNECVIVVMRVTMTINECVIMSV